MGIWFTSIYGSQSWVFKRIMWDHKSKPSKQEIKTCIQEINVDMHKKIHTWDNPNRFSSNGYGNGYITKKKHKSFNPKSNEAK